MEMNTRLQVEHPVTEAITGVDLVEWQLRVAAGEALPCAQEDLSITGHAFEARLYAEDVPKGFLPATGRLAHLAFPEGARADTGVRQGDQISPWYDPMIAKIITHGPTRNVALQQMERALSRTEVAGSVTNLAFLRALTRHDGFAAGAVDTGLIERDLEALAAEPEACSRAQSLAALAALGLHQDSGAMQGFALWQPMRQNVAIGYRDEIVTAEIETLAPGQFRVTIGDAVHVVDRDGDRWRIDGAPVSANVVRHDPALSVFWGNAYGFDLIDPLEVAAEAGVGAGVIEAPMPGLVKAVFVEPGQTVAQGDRLAILEAMKMEHTLSAGRDGVVEEVLVVPGSQVEAGAALIKLEDEA